MYNLKIHPKQRCTIHAKSDPRPNLFRRCEFCGIPDTSPGHTVYQCVFAGEKDLSDEQWELMKKEKAQPTVIVPREIAKIHGDK